MIGCYLVYKQLARSRPVAALETLHFTPEGISRLGRGAIANYPVLQTLMGA